ncbi:hypothetical protein [Deinococcus sp. 23YEL01]|nr:hypothetical protein [Deinococcus sp. 23YEL01]
MRQFKVLLMTLIVTLLPISSYIGGELVPCSPFPECIPPIQIV